MDTVRILCALHWVEVNRKSAGPGRVLARLRSVNTWRSSRSAELRHDLRSLIAAIDRLLPGEPNCFRRVLLEVALDNAAATERVVLGVKSGLARRSGHAWFLDTADVGERYDAELVI